MRFVEDRKQGEVFISSGKMSVRRGYIRTMWNLK
jgi:hypothetical protein